MFYQHGHPTVYTGHGHALMAEEHLHNEIEMIFCVKGSYQAIINSESYDVGEGQLSVAFPNQSHYYLTEKDKPLEVYMVIFSAKILPEIESFISASLPFSAIFTPQDINYIIRLFENMHKFNNKHNDYDTLRRVGFCKLLCAELFEHCEFVPIRKTDPNVLSSIIDYCNQNFTNDIHLSDLEDHLHINKYYISHLFKDKIRMGFNEYIHSLRIKAACKQLTETDDTITEIASDVGYNTVRNFNRFFLKITGVTPSKYREKESKKESK